MICTICDEDKESPGGEALINMTDGACCRIFGINSTSIDVFKEYFFSHGVFIYKSFGSTTTEYDNVLSYFRNS